MQHQTLVLQEAKTAGIPVIVVDRQIDCDESLYAGFLGEDGYEEGEYEEYEDYGMDGEDTEEYFDEEDEETGNE